MIDCYDPTNILLLLVILCLSILFFITRHYKRNIVISRLGHKLYNLLLPRIFHSYLPILSLTKDEADRIRHMTLPLECVEFHDDQQDLNAKQRLKNFISKNKKVKRIITEKLEKNPKYNLLLVFVNEKSGNREGLVAYNNLKKILNPLQVYKTSKKSFVEAFNLFKNVPNFTIAVAGGDGTLSWVSEELEARKNDLLCTNPPLVCFPFGTGNDLSNHFNWIGASPSLYSLMTDLLDIQDANVVNLDKFRVAIKIQDQEDIVQKGLLAYAGIGVDAAISLNFHNQRENNPDLFKVNRYFNKFIYALSGAKEILLSRFTNFSSKIELYCDDELIDLPKNLAGIIILNISSYGGGVDLWRAAKPIAKGKSNANTTNDEHHSVDSVFHNLTRHMSSDKLSSNIFALDAAKKNTCLPQSCSDSYLEIVGVRSSFELGKAQVSLAEPIRIAKAKKIKIKINCKEIPIQIDGEPFIMKNNSEVDVNFSNQVLMMKRRKYAVILSRDSAPKDISLGKEVLDWAKLNKTITNDQYGILVNELASRANE